MDITGIMNELTTEEKAALVSGTDFLYTNPIPRLSIPSLCMSDGPHGLRKQTGNGDNGIGQSEPATAFPTASATAAGWNPDNLFKMGQAIGKECRYYGVHTLLGPGVNLKRNPLCGRNFEYFSEDPYLSGVMGAAETEGVQSTGVGVCIKHFALNNSENFRFMGNSAASERTIRTLYLKPFEYIVRQAKPAAVMCAYNQINGTFCSENKWLLTDILRKEWNFDGVVMTDWGAVHHRIAGLTAGLDLEMPGDTAICRRWILDGIADGTLAMEDLDRACRNILHWIDQYAAPSDPEEPDWDSHDRLAAEIAADCAVLMKNDRTLPLTGREKIRAEGPFFSRMRYQGAGSSMITPTRITSPKDAFDKRGVKYDYSLEDCDTVLFFGGLTDEYETEGWDREHMHFPEDQQKAINDLCGAGKKVVVILFGGSPVELPFHDRVHAILNMYLPGQNGGSAAARLLFGESNPSGKLAETWPLCYEDVPGHEHFGKSINEVYSEGTDMGYRYYNRHGVPVRYPFGHGLSYTTFSHTDWVQENNTYTQVITNTGSCFGGEVAQLYVNGELRGFKKVYLAPGESAAVTLMPEPEDDRIFSDELKIPAEPPRLPITLESRLTDLKQSFMGRILFHAILSLAANQARKAERMPGGEEKDNMRKGAQFLHRILESSSLRSMSMSAGKSLPYNIAQGLAELANGHPICGAKYFLSPIKVPKLPKEK